MPAITRQVGTTSEYLPVFIPDATVSTGVGLANIVASSVTLAWFRSDMSAVSSQTCTTGTLGTFASSSFTQASSTLALGWYGISLPNGVFVSGKSAAVHLSGAPNMAPVPILIEITRTDNQTFFSSQALSTNALVNINQILGSTPVTSQAGMLAMNFDLGRISNPTSTVALTGLSLSTNQLVNMNQLLGTSPVTTSPGIFDVQNSVWEASAASHNSSGTLGAKLNSAGSAGDPWGTALPGAYGVGTAGNILGNNLDAHVSSRLALSGYTAPDNTGISAISSKTVNLPAAPAATGDAMTLTAAYDFAKGTTTITESYAADGAAATPAQLLYQIWAILAERGIVSTTLTANKLDGITPAMTFTLDSASAPTTQTRAT